jgi:hypothetical protein
MKLHCYSLMPKPPRLVPAAATRRWMDEFPYHHAYRCLPLSIANAYGWEIQSPCALTIEWNGGPAASDISFSCEDDYRYLNHLVASNFTHGIVTFHTGYLFQTEPGWNLVATGPFNSPKDGCAPLTGVIETDWLPYPFTMNWQLTRPGRFRFERGEPFCVVFPVAQNALESTQPEIVELKSNPELQEQLAAWRARREEFMVRFRAGDEETFREAWQRFYFKGERPDGTDKIAHHKAKLHLAVPINRLPGAAADRSGG